jgi:1-phosphofructokinase family hexose kinase
MTGHLICVAPNPSIDRFVEVRALVAGTIHRPVREVATAGGKGLNVARVARTLGGDATAVAVLAGHAGAWIEEQLARAGIRVVAAWVPGETRTCISIADASTGALTEVYERGGRVPEDAWGTVGALLEAELAAARSAGSPAIVTLSGSLPLGAPPDGMGHLAAICARGGAMVVADTYGEALRHVLPARPAVVKVNAVEAEEATGIRVAGDVRAAVRAARLLRDRGAEAAIVTLGVDGAVIATEGGTWRVAAAPDPGPYPVGSGDAFMAGLALRILAGDSLPDAARSAAGAAAANALVFGTGELDPAVARSLASEIAVEPLT